MAKNVSTTITKSISSGGGGKSSDHQSAQGEDKQSEEPFNDSNISGHEALVEVRSSGGGSCSNSGDGTTTGTAATTVKVKIDPTNAHQCQFCGDKPLSLLVHTGAYIFITCAVCGLKFCTRCCEKMPNPIPQELRYSGLQTHLSPQGIGYVCKSGRCLRECKTHWMIEFRKQKTKVRLFCHPFFYFPSSPLR